MPLSIIGTLGMAGACEKGQLIDFMNEFLRFDTVLVQYRREIN